MNPFKQIILFAGLMLMAIGARAQQPAAEALEYGVVNISVCNMRRTAHFDAEMVSQALLGTPVHVLEISQNGNPWPLVQSPDGYKGWVHYAAVTRMNKADYHAWNAAPKVIVTALFGTVHAKASARSGAVSDVVAGCRLKYLGRRGCWFKVGFPDGREGFIRRSESQTEDVWRKKLDTSAKAILKTAESMLGFPYIWAGMSPKGMDCSGYVRTVLFMHDIILPRDAGPQSRVGTRISDRSELQPGDLVFFGRWDGSNARVSHVGFYLGEGRFIHSMGLVQKGSFNPKDPLYDAFNTGRYLFGTRILGMIENEDGISTTLTNPFYCE